MDNSKYEAVRANITETISLLDEPKANGIESIILIVEVQENGIIRNSKGRLIGRLVNDIDYKSEHIEGMKKEVKSLRKAALDGERYRKAGEDFVYAVGQFTESSICFDANYPHCIHGILKQALAAYRQAVEQK